MLIDHFYLSAFLNKLCVYLLCRDQNLIASGDWSTHLLTDLSSHMQATIFFLLEKLQFLPFSFYFLFSMHSKAFLFLFSIPFSQEFEFAFKLLHFHELPAASLQTHPIFLVCNWYHSPFILISLYWISNSLVIDQFNYCLRDWFRND